jgi:hypothetical protein
MSILFAPAAFSRKFALALNARIEAEAPYPSRDPPQHNRGEDLESDGYNLREVCPTSSVEPRHAAGSWPSVRHEDAALFQDCVAQALLPVRFSGTNRAHG